MTVTEILAMADQAGVRLSIDGPDILLKHDLDPPRELIEAIRRNKADILATHSELKEETEDDWGHVSATPDRLTAFARLVAITRARQTGRTPDHYTARTVCQHCGEVPIWEGAPAKVEGCPWCNHE